MKSVAAEVTPLTNLPVPEVPVRQEHHDIAGETLMRLVATHRPPTSPHVHVTMRVREVDGETTGRVQHIVFSTNQLLMSLAPLRSSYAMPSFREPRWKGLWRPRFYVSNQAFEPEHYFVNPEPEFDAAIFTPNDAAIFLNFLRNRHYFSWQSVDRYTIFPDWHDHESFVRYIREDFFVIPDSHSAPSINHQLPSVPARHEGSAITPP